MRLGRLALEGQTTIVRQSAFLTGMFAVVASCALFGVFCLLYLLKAVLGINLFKEASPFHPLYDLFFKY